MRALKPTSLLAGLLVLALAPTGSRADIVTNGSFEDPSLGGGGSQLISAGSGGLTGWTVAGTAGVTLLADPLAFGSQDLAMNNLTSNTISQVITTAAGLDYHFSIAFKAGELKATSGVAKVLDGSTELLSYTMSTSSTGWTIYSGTFTAGSAATTILIQGFYSTSSTNLIVDAVSVSAVPEPGSLALCALAGGCLAAFGRKRFVRNRSAA